MCVPLCDFIMPKNTHQQRLESKPLKLFYVSMGNQCMPLRGSVAIIVSLSYCVMAKYFWPRDIPINHILIASSLFWTLLTCIAAAVYLLTVVIINTITVCFNCPITAAARGVHPYNERNCVYSCTSNFVQSSRMRVR